MPEVRSFALDKQGKIIDVKAQGLKAGDVITFGNDPQAYRVVPLPDGSLTAEAIPTKPTKAIQRVLDRLNAPVSIRHHGSRPHHSGFKTGGAF